MMDTMEQQAVMEDEQEQAIEAEEQFIHHMRQQHPQVLEDEARWLYQRQNQPPPPPHARADWAPRSDGQGGGWHG